MFEQRAFWRRKLHEIRRCIPADRVALFTGATLMACGPAPQAAADMMGGRYHSETSQQLPFGFTFDEVLGLVLAIAAILFVVHLGKRR